MLRAENLRFGYEGIPVLHDTALEVEPGEILALVGPNGGGKTTLLRVLAGLERPSEGSVHLDGTDLTTLSTEERVARGLAVVFGGRASFGGLSVVDNLVAGAELIHRDRALVSERLDEVFTTFPRLAERKTALAAQLSGGEQQMLGIGKAFMTGPKVLCIDELSLGLAPELVARLLDVLRGQNAAGTTLLLIEQSVNVALDIADRIAYFERGRVVTTESASRLAEDPGLLQRLFMGDHQGAVV